MKQKLNFMQYQILCILEKTMSLIQMQKMKIFFLIALLSITMGCAQNTSCTYQGGTLDYLTSIRCRQDFTVLESKPLSQNYGNVQSIKLIYDIKKQSIYFIDSKKYTYHFDFCSDYLKSYDDLIDFNNNEYSDSPKRKYVLANLNYYAASGLYTLELFADDRCPASYVLAMYQSVQKHTYFAEQVRLLNKTAETQRIINENGKKIPFVSVDEIFGKQTFQPMIIASSYGYLRKVDKLAFDTFAFKKHDIIVTNFLPNNFPYAQGIVTSVFQTPLCHVNILSHNRKTPNCAYKLAFDDALIKKYLNQLVYFEVTADTFIIRKADPKKAMAYWNLKEHKPTKILNCNTTVNTLLDIKNVNMYSVSVVGGKAANFGELDKIKLNDNSKIPMPEGAFAIPFYFYKQHLMRNNILPLITNLLVHPEIKEDRVQLEKALQRIQDSILKSPIDASLLLAVMEKLKANGTYTEFRFRSSTNAEDVPGFNGAGLYDSKTGSVTNPKKTVELAIKKVWASLWDIRAFEEREAASISQSSVAMGVLVHRAFGTEEANGVAITKDLYRKGYPAFTINIQKGENSVVLPTDSSTCEQFLIKFSGALTGNHSTAVEYISHSSLNEQKALLTDAEIEILTNYLVAIKHHFYSRLNMAFKGVDYDDFGMDVEFKLDKTTRKIYIKQARTY